MARDPFTTVTKPRVPSDYSCLIENSILLEPSPLINLQLRLSEGIFFPSIFFMIFVHFWHVLSLIFAFLNS